MSIAFSSFFFFNDTATTEIYTLSLHDALPIYALLRTPPRFLPEFLHDARTRRRHHDRHTDRKSTRLNSSHQIISYAVFCLKKKKIHAEMRGTQTTRANLPESASRVLGAMFSVL